MENHFYLNLKDKMHDNSWQEYKCHILTMRRVIQKINQVTNASNN